MSQHEGPQASPHFINILGVFSVIVAVHAVHIHRRLLNLENLVILSKIVPSHERPALPKIKYSKKYTSEEQNAFGQKYTNK